MFQDPKPKDPDFFAPGGYSHVDISRNGAEWQAKARRGDHEGPVLLRRQQLRGMLIELHNAGWQYESISLTSPIPLEELPALEPTNVPVHLQRIPALALPDIEQQICQCYHYPDPEDHASIHDAFAKLRAKPQTSLGHYDFGGIDMYLDRMRPELISSHFSVTQLCQLQASSVYSKNDKYKLALENELAPLILDRIRLSAWHNHAHQFPWDEYVTIYESLRRFTVGLPDFTVELDHTTSCNPKGYSKYLRIFLDGEIAFFISYKGKRVLVISFNFTRPHRNQGPAVYVKQIQLLSKTGNRWLYHLPCHFMEFFLDRLRTAFVDLPVYLIRGPVLAQEIRDNYERSLKRAEEFLESRSTWSDERYRQQKLEEILELKQRIANIELHVATRLEKNYGRRASSFRRRKRGNFWKLLPAPQPKLHEVHDRELAQPSAELTPAFAHG